MSAQKDEGEGTQYFNCSSSLIRCTRLTCHIYNWPVNSESAKLTLELEIDLSVMGKNKVPFISSVESARAHITSNTPWGTPRGSLGAILYAGRISIQSTSWKDLSICWWHELCWYSISVFSILVHLVQNVPANRPPGTITMLLELVCTDCAGHRSKVRLTE